MLCSKTFSLYTSAAEVVKRADIEKQVEETSAIESSLDVVTAVAETAVAHLAEVSTASAAVVSSVSDAQELIHTIQRELQEQRRRRNELKAAIKAEHAVRVAELTFHTSQLEREIAALRQESTKTDCDIIAANGEIDILTQRLASSRVALTSGAEGEDDDGAQGVGAAVENEHAMVQNDRLFLALTTIPTVERVNEFMRAMANDAHPSDQRNIRYLIERSERLPDA